MSGSVYGTIFKISTWGESHGAGVGVVVDGCPAGLPLNEEDIQKYLDRRKPGQSKFTTARSEGDKAEILSGVFEGKTTGTPISIVIRNTDQRSRDYSNIMDVYRPGHADYTLPQFWERPSSALVKCSAHFAFSCVQHGSRSKWNSASRSSKRACGVAHSTDTLENKQLFFCNESLHHIQHTWQRHAVPPHLVSRAVASVYAVLPPIREALQSATLKRRKPPDKVAPRLF